ncbi:MAG: hypothetical protein WCP73_06540 [Eubacteriales bacterium]
MIKRLTLLMAILFVAAGLAACAPAATVTVANEQLNFVKMDLSDSYANILPSQGNKILTVKFLAQNENPDMTKISDAFFGQTPSTISNGTASVPCKSIAFEKNTNEIIVALIFDVPENFKTSVSKLTLSGSDLKAIELNL